MTVGALSWPGRCLEAWSAFALPVGPTMRRLGSVQRKMPCVFVTEVKEEPSSKREHQVPRSAGPVERRRRASGLVRAALQAGNFLQVSLGRSRVGVSCSLSSRFLYLLSCKGRNL